MRERESRESGPEGCPTGTKSGPDDANTTNSGSSKGK